MRSAALVREARAFFSIPFSACDHSFGEISISFGDISTPSNWRVYRIRASSPLIRTPSVISRAYHLERGYEDLVGKLVALGALVKEVDLDEDTGEQE